MAHESKADLVIDLSHRDDFVNVNIDITFPKIPCDILSIDVEDILGTHKTDVMGELHKKRLDKSGKQVNEETAKDKQEWHGSIYERVKKELTDEQGCRLDGAIQIYRVPGNVHVASHPYRDIVAKLEMDGKSLDFEYTVNHFSMGNKRDFDYIAQQFDDLEMEHPVDGLYGKPERDDKDVPKFMKTLIYLVAVPSYFEKSIFKYHVYQLISNYEITHDKEHTESESILMFNFEFSPITENVTQNHKKVIEFLISICAIIGGVYTIAGIVDSVIHKSVSVVFKSRIGKLS
jgi:hypothetical protein